MVPTPAALVQEGIAELGPSIVRDDDLRGSPRRRARQARARLRRRAIREAIAEARRALRAGSASTPR